MSDYTQSTDFSAKDSLTTGDPNKLIRGSEFDTEFSLLSSAVASKSNKVSSPTTDNVASLTVTGDLADSGIAKANVADESTTILPQKGIVQSTYPGLTGASGAQTIDWNDGNHQYINLTANVTMSFTAPSSGAAAGLSLRVVASSTAAITWPSAVKWAGGTAPTLTGSSKTDVFTFLWDGTNYYGAYNLDLR